MPPADCPIDDHDSILVQLVYELLDAHADTTGLSGVDPSDVRWRAHLTYLQGLQRVGREVLAVAVASRSLA
ncbi:MAG TPA: hypothetical protein VME22_04725 [Solirubrobacteraceae bacterium]|nr:hypothetical protein [Solirubrobacteraceae bacterium]